MLDPTSALVKPKIGILFFTSGWFREVGLQDPSSDTTARVQAVARQIVESLSKFLEPIFSGVLFSAEQAKKEARRIAAEGVDGLLVSPLMWCEDQIVRAALAELPGLPLVLWTYSPASTLPKFVPFQSMIQGSGAVCTLQVSGMLKREGRRYWSVVGPLGDRGVLREIRSYALAMAVARRLRSLGVGVLPFPCAHMSTTYVDEFDLRRLYGIELRYLELERFRQTAQGVAGRQIEEFRSEIEASGQIIKVDERNLHEGIKYALAMESILREESIQALAMNDVIGEMHRSFGLRPCLSNPHFSGTGAVVSMEADIAAGVAMYALRQFTGHSPFYTEPFSADYEHNALLLGHAGYHDAANREEGQPVEIVPDVEYQNSDPFSGAVSFFKYRSGPVTLVNSVWDGERLKWVALSGRSLEGPPKMDGNSHLFCALEVPVKEFFRRAVESGVSQHWIAVHDGHLEDIPALCDILNIRLEKLTA